MIVITSGELVGLLADVTPFAPEAKDDPHHGVLLEWTGATLRAHAADALSAGLSTWDPEGRWDAPPAELGGKFGASREDEPRWRVFLALSDVAEIVKTFKVAVKQRHAPVSVRANDAGTRLIIERTRDTGLTEHLMMVRPTGAEVSFPDIMAAVAETEKHAEPVFYIRAWAHRLAAFANAGRHGPFTQGFAGEHPLVVMAAGGRFVGYYTPETESRRPGADDAEATA